MIIVIDNYDSFVHNLARYCRLAGAETLIIRNDEKSVTDILAFDLTGVVLSPGPKAPQDAGVCLELLERLPATIPVLGVCLGHQCLVEAYGGETIRAERPLHGRASSMTHDGRGLFSDFSSPIDVGRYHSLISKVPDGGPLIECGWSEEGETMAVRSEDRDWYGVQFHPESILTPQGMEIVKRFIQSDKEATSNEKRDRYDLAKWKYPAR